MKKINLVKYTSILFLSSVIAVSCSSSDSEDISASEYVTTGEAINISPLTATIEGQVNQTFAAAYLNVGVQLSTSQSFVGSDVIECYADGITGKNFTVQCVDYNDDGALEANTTYYYRAFVNMAGTKQFGSTKSFTTVNFTPATSGTVKLGGTEWAACNLNASRPEQEGTCFLNNALNWNYDQIDIDGDTYSGNSKYDCTTMELGWQWRTPTDDDWQTLINESKITFSTYNGVNGIIASDGKTGNNCIFLPLIDNSNCKTSLKSLAVYATASWSFLSDIMKLQQLIDEKKEAMEQNDCPRIESVNAKIKNMVEGFDDPEFCLVPGEEPSIQYLNIFSAGSTSWVYGQEVYCIAQMGTMVRPVKK